MRAGETRHEQDPAPGIKAPPDGGSSPPQSAAALAREIEALREEISGLRSDLQRLIAALERENSTRHGRATLARAHSAIGSAATSPIKLAHRWTAQAMTRPRWTPPHGLAWTIAAGITLVVVAFVLRGASLSSTPPGLQGDEAATGLEARRILDDGWIGVYTGSAGGNPTGVYYLATIPVHFIEDPVVAVRMLSAVAGTIAVLALFLLAYRDFGIGPAIVAATILVFSGWHIHFSRTGFVTGTWPTVALLGAIALSEAIRSRRWQWWFLAGALLASGTYVYNGHGPILLLLCVYSLWTLVGWPAVFILAAVSTAVLFPSIVSVFVAALSLLLFATGRFRERRALVNLGVFTFAVLLVLRGLIDFIRVHRHDYFGRGEQLSVFHSDQWKTRLTYTDKAMFLLGRYKEFWDRVTFHPIPDGVDVSGVAPLIPKTTLGLCLIGMTIALARRPTPLVRISAAIVALAPLTAVLTDLALRRALVLMPFLALLGGVGCVEIVQVIWARRGQIAGYTTAITLIALLAYSGYENWTGYFRDTLRSDSARHTMSVDMRDAAEYLGTLPSSTFIYLFSDRWVIGFEDIRLLAPHVRGENRLPKWGGDGSFAISPERGDPVFLLLGNQRAYLPEIQRIYPGGIVVEGPPLASPINGPAYIAYWPVIPGGTKLPTEPLGRTGALPYDSRVVRFVTIPDETQT